MGGLQASSRGARVGWRVGWHCTLPLFSTQSLRHRLLRCGCCGYPGVGLPLAQLSETTDAVTEQTRVLEQLQVSLATVCSRPALASFRGWW